MGERGMADMTDMQMPLPDNTAPMMAGAGPFGSVEMGGMFTVVKVRRGSARYRMTGVAPEQEIAMKEREAWTSDVVEDRRQMSKGEGVRGHKMGRPVYALFALNMLLGLVIMYLVMFTMVDTRSDFRNNLNLLYMAVTITAPMGSIMLLSMRGMYPNKTLNLALHAAVHRAVGEPA